jgi:hypothetical protein
VSSQEETERLERLNRLCGELDALQREARGICAMADVGVQQAHHDTRIRTAGSRLEGRAETAPPSDKT